MDPTEAKGSEGVLSPAQATCMLPLPSIRVKVRTKKNNFWFFSKIGSVIWMPLKGILRFMDVFSF